MYCTDPVYKEQRHAELEKQIDTFAKNNCPTKDQIDTFLFTRD